MRELPVSADEAAAHVRAGTTAHPRQAILDLVKLTPLMRLTLGRPDVVIGLLDGPVECDHPQLRHAAIQQARGAPQSKCIRVHTVACRHGTQIAGVLSAHRESPAPAICPACTLVVRPIFDESGPMTGALPITTPRELAAAIVDCVRAGARLLNMSIDLTSIPPEPDLDNALAFATMRGVLVVAAIGNHLRLSNSTIAHHPWIIPVAACDRSGAPLPQLNLGSSIGRRGLLAPGSGVTSLRAGGGSIMSGGTSIATSFVTGTAALMWSLIPGATPSEIRIALTHAHLGDRVGVVPPLLDAYRGYQVLRAISKAKATA